MTFLRNPWKTRDLWGVLLDPFGSQWLGSTTGISQFHGMFQWASTKRRWYLLDLLAPQFAAHQFNSYRRKFISSCGKSSSIRSFTKPVSLPVSLSVGWGSILYCTFMCTKSLRTYQHETSAHECTIWDAPSTTYVQFISYLRAALILFALWRFGKRCTPAPAPQNFWLSLHSQVSRDSFVGPTWKWSCVNSNFHFPKH